MGPQMGPGSYQNAILEQFQAQAPEWAQEVPRTPFWSISKPRPQNGPRKLPERVFGAFPKPGRRWAQEVTRTPFSSISKPRPQNGASTHASNSAHTPANKHRQISKYAYL